ncbi:MAG: TetR family transcriptional regulator C-terminal domain-containing protein, partial [Myxococcota bacterium]|nr:TetR family transcriptional regulator C-terminal domain-containing protein [Myxococcota bacterium]
LNQLESEHRGEKDGGPTLSTLELELSLAAVRQPRLREKMVSRQKRYRRLLAEVIEQIAADQKLELPMRSQDLAIALSALCDGLLVAGLNDPESVPDDLLAQFILSTVIAASKPQA